MISPPALIHHPTTTNNPYSELWRALGSSGELLESSGELAKTLMIENFNFHRQVLRDNQGHDHTPRPQSTIHSLKPQRWKHHRLSRSHTASHRTHERNETISRLSHPPTSDIYVGCVLRGGILGGDQSSLLCLTDYSSRKMLLSFYR